MGILWNYVGGVGQTKATAVAKLPYEYGETVKNMKLYTLVYDGVLLKGYLNGELIQTDDNIEAGTGTIGTLFFGGDYDDTCWLKGKMPEFMMFNKELNDVDRTNFENYLSDKWLNTGTVLHSGHVVGINATLPTFTDGNARIYLDFNETGIVTNEAGQVVEWSSTPTQFFTTPIKANVLNGRTGSIAEQKNKSCMYFDKTFMQLDNIDSAHSPDTYTIMFLVDFENFDSTPYVDGDGAQVILSSTSNNRFRIKKFDAENYLGVRFRDWDGRSFYIDFPREKVLGSSIVNQDIGVVKLHLGTSLNTMLPYGNSIIVNNHSMFGTAKFDISGLQENTKYYGVFYVNDVIDLTSSFEFKTLPIGSKSFKVVVGSCNRTGSVAPTWDKIAEEEPDMFIHLGDLNYLDLNSNNKQQYAEALDISFSEPIKRLVKKVPFQYVYDNHDSLKPTVSVDDGAWIPFLEFVRDTYAYQTPGSNNIVNDGLYSSFTIGRVRFISLDCRRNRTQQRQPDDANKTMLGLNQKAWFKQELLNAKNDINIESIMILSQVIWTADRNNPSGDSYDSWGASWASYATERNEIANFIYDNKIKNVAYICADVHMQAIDDGRNSCYITDSLGNKVDVNTIDKAYWTPMLESSPFDQYLSSEGGPFNVNDGENSGGGISGSSEQSYGVIEVLDAGENWLQIKMYTMALFNGEWSRNRYYTYNIKCENGKVGIAPPLDWSLPDEPNKNGYVFVGDAWKKVTRRHIKVNNTFKPQQIKFKFVNGKWRKIYDENTFDSTNIIQLDQINSWTNEPYNWIKVTGNGFLDVSYPSRYGGYYELATNGGDLFGNFPYMTTFDSPVYGVIEDVKSIQLTGKSYLRSPNNIGTGLFFNMLYDKDFSLGFWTHIKANDFINGNISPLITDATNTYGFFAIKENDNIFLSVNLGVNAKTKQLLNEGWNRVILNFKNGNNSEHSFLHIDNSIYNLTGFIVDDFGFVEVNSMPFYFGHKTSSQTITATLANFYYVGRYNTDTQVKRYITKPNIDIVLYNLDTKERYIIPQQWRMGVNDTSISFTMPEEVVDGDYSLVVESLNYSSNELPMKIKREQVRKTPYATSFTSVDDFRNNFNIFHKAWGGANGGVVVQNVELLPDKLRLWANGDLYTGNIQGVNRDGDAKFHTNIQDPKHGQPWTNRVGGVIVFKEKTGFGSYRVRAKIPTELGVCSAFWTFFYNEIYPSDVRWDDFISDGLHQQGNNEDGYYMTRNHEIDIELPSHLDGGKIYEPSFNNMKCNTWRGELQNGDVPSNDSAYWEEYRDNLTPIGIDMYDGQEREFRFDWYEDRVEFFIDGILKQTNRNEVNKKHIPTIAGHFTFGLWFPSSPHQTKPWLVRPDRAWAGGILDVDGGRKAMFDRVYMDVSHFSYTPFDNSKIINTAETYPFGSYRKY